MSSWADVDFEEIDSGVYPEALKEWEQWMCRPEGEKRPYAPWSDKNAPAPCSKCSTTTAECEHSARYKWGWEGNYTSFTDAEMCLVDEKIGGVVFIQREEDPFLFVDGDDVRDPETGDVHPGFVSILNDLGMSYADISTSGRGVHAYYRGALPNEETEASWKLADEPWGENDDAPAIEIYSGKHVCLTTGDHVNETLGEVRPWDGEAVREVLQEHDVADEDEHTILDAFNSSENGETDDAFGDDSTSNSQGDRERSPVDAVNSLNAQRVADRTIVREWNDSASTSKGEAAFWPTWGSVSSDSGTANIVNADWWVDTGDHGGSGGPIEMAAIDMGILNERHSEPGAVSGEDWWRAYEHLQNLGFNLPDRHEGEQHSDYYDAPLGEYTDGDPWSEPEAMLEACLQARARGVVDEDSDPPHLALAAIAKELLGDVEFGDGTREMLVEVYHNEMEVADI